MTPKRLEQSYRQTYRRLIAMVFAYLLVAVAGIALLINHPRTADWASQAVRAEFATTNASASR